jgi:ABC-type spermidine/putrescine transport system permease subunit I
VFLLLPLANIAMLSVFTYSPSQIWSPIVTSTNYLRLWDPYYLALIARTLMIGAITTVVCALVAYPVAYFLARARPRVMTAGLFLLIMPLMVSSVIRAFGWVVLLGRQGLVNRLLVGLGLDGVQLLYTPGAVIVALAEFLLPFMVLPLMASIETIPRSLEEAARNLGASSPQVFRRVIFPLTIPGLLSGALLVYSVSISALVIPALLGGKNVRMLGNQIYEEVLVSFNWPFASSLTMLLIAVTLVATFVGLRLARPAGRPDGRS